MNAEEIAKLVCEKTYLNLCKQCEPGADPGFVFDQYWERNKEFFMEQAKAYLAVKECLEAK